MSKGHTYQPMTTLHLITAMLMSGLTILFHYLKLTGQSEMSWWWVWSPLWVPGSFTLVLAMLGAFIHTIYAKRKRKHGYGTLRNTRL